MHVRLLHQANYDDQSFAKGATAQVLMQSMVKGIPSRELQGRLKVMSDKYRKNGRKGLFAKLGGKWRWLEKGDYEILEGMDA
jgi:hypothetical protein